MGNELGKYLKKIRKVNNFTQEFVASSLDISRQAYSHYETGRATPPYDTCYKLAKLYNISVDLIYGIQLNAEDEIDGNIYTQKEEVIEFINLLDDDESVQKYKKLDKQEKELIFFFNSLSNEDKEELIEIAKLKKKLHKA